ncbi:PDZ domain-containing protein [Candidatus Desantisbacteria bacterium]|nr:PDZ domain-containing protein [Candidatus Desantisbacteria bacterium]
MVRIEDFNRILATKKIGDQINITIIRNLEKQKLSITLENGWEKTQKVMLELGLKVKPVTKENLWGIVVIDITKNSKAEKYGINKHDIILGINRSYFKNLKEFSEITSHVNLEKEIYLLVMRKDDHNDYITVTKQIGEQTGKKEEKKKTTHR